MVTNYYNIAGYHFAFHNQLGTALKFPPGFSPFEAPASDQLDGTYTFVDEGERPIDAADTNQTYIDCETWRFGRTQNEKLYMDIQYVPNQFWQPAAYLEPDFSNGLLFPKKYNANELFPYTWFFPIDEQLLLNRIAWLDGALIHCCGIQHQGKAILFCGKSGAGKSTTAELWPAAGATLMNDDRIIIRPRDEGYVASATPWHGTVQEINPAILPIAAVFHLHQAKEDRVEPIPYAQSVQRIMANAIAPFYFKTSMSRVMQTLSTAMQNVPSYHLHFTPDQGAVEAVKSVL